MLQLYGALSVGVGGRFHTGRQSPEEGEPSQVISVEAVGRHKVVERQVLVALVCEG
jgi:hypothetical protein